MYVRLCKFLAAFCTVLLTPSAVAAASATDDAVIKAGPAADTAVIKALAAEAYVWGLGPEFIERSSKYNTIIGAPFNALKYSPDPAAWNNDATNAGDSSVLYVSGFVNFNQAPELVLTVPPSRNQYYVAAYYDAYANTIGSIGTRTTSSDAMRSYLLVGPRSPYAKKQTVTIHGYEYRVMASDTNINLFLIRARANTLIGASAPGSVPNVVKGVTHKFALNSLQEFEANGHQPVYPSSFDLPAPTQQQIHEAAPYQDAPHAAVRFFTQLGNAVAANPIPSRRTGLSGTALTNLPRWMVPQYGARTKYVVPSYGQKAKFDSFTPIGLTKNGFSVPADWGRAQRAALQAGYLLGQKLLKKFITSASPSASTNYWAIVNKIIGTYPNNKLGYLLRSLTVVEGGVANIASDAVYPTLGGNPLSLDGNNTYKITFTSSYPGLPAKGIYPPMVSGATGNPKGFWSVSVYATDPMQSTAPFIAQSSVQNTHYSTADTSVLSVDAAANSMTVKAPQWGTLAASTPILFGGHAAAYGLTPGSVYYVASAPKANAAKTRYTFKVSTQWLQELAHGPNGSSVPVQGTGGKHGPIVDLRSPVGAGTLSYGMVQPVSQLGSSQLVANQLARNHDGSLTIWVGPTLPAGAPRSNWIPTPSTTYYRDLYPKAQISTAFQLTLRMYYPTPGDKPPSILPCPQPQGCAESYIPPRVQLVPGGAQQH